jgi:hypothetical protein
VQLSTNRIAAPLSLLPPPSLRSVVPPPAQKLISLGPMRNPNGEGGDSCWGAACPTRRVPFSAHCAMAKARPEHVTSADLFYDESEAAKYTMNSRMVFIQRQMAQRCLELLNLDASPQFLLDIGCGSGLSGGAYCVYGIMASCEGGGG